MVMGMTMIELILRQAAGVPKVAPGRDSYGRCGIIVGHQIGDMNRYSTKIPRKGTCSDF